MISSLKLYDVMLNMMDLQTIIGQWWKSKHSKNMHATAGVTWTSLITIIFCAYELVLCEIYLWTVDSFGTM